MTTLETRLARLEAAQALERDALAIPDWLAAFRRGDDVATRNAVAGAAWCAMAAERERLALSLIHISEPTRPY